MLLCYKGAIKKTIEVRKQLKITNEQLSELNDDPKEIVDLQTQLDSLNNTVEKLYNKSSLQDIILDRIVKYCNQNNVLIKEFPESQILEKDNYIIKTNYILLEGSFQQLIILLYNIEQKYNLGKVSSLKFYTTTNSKTRLPQLYLELYIQNIETNEK